MAWIRAVAWIRLDDRHLGNITGDHRTRFRYRTRDNHRDEFGDAVWWSGTISRITRPRATTVRWIRAG